MATAILTQIQIHNPPKLTQQNPGPAQSTPPKPTGLGVSSGTGARPDTSAVVGGAAHKGSAPGWGGAGVGVWWWFWFRLTVQNYLSIYLSTYLSSGEGWWARLSRRKTQQCPPDQ